MADEKKKLAAVLGKLQIENKELQLKIDGSSMSSEYERKTEIMNLLHSYNEIKDATHSIIGALANLEGVTIKHIHKQVNLPTNDF